jgi:lipopolysaccharide/colanic/teichoic acid biosynthesis glycosyltransferase
MLRSGRLHQSRERVVRRGSDVVIAAISLILAAPFILIIALVIVADTPGPVFFSQPRLGRHGRHFRLHKFRKFRNDVGPGGRDVTLRGDPRLTRIGRLLERTKMDELPQLWNVLTGDMSIVGPRPESLAFGDCFIGPFQRVLDHTPGLFGPSQVAFRHEGRLFPPDRDPHEFYRTILFPLKAHIDLTYFPRRTLRSDIGWMVRGILAVAGMGAVRDQCPQSVAELQAWLGQAASPHPARSVRVGHV